MTIHSVNAPVKNVITESCSSTVEIHALTDKFRGDALRKLGSLHDQRNRGASATPTELLKVSVAWS